MVDLVEAGATAFRSTVAGGNVVRSGMDPIAAKLALTAAKWAEGYGANERAQRFSNDEKFCQEHPGRRWLPRPGEAASA